MLAELAVQLDTASRNVNFRLRNAIQMEQDEAAMALST